MMVQSQFSEERIVFSTNGAGTTDYPYAKKMNFNLSLTPYMNINSKSSKLIRLEQKLKTMKLKWEKIFVTSGEAKVSRYDSRSMIYKVKN